VKSRRKSAVDSQVQTQEISWHVAIFNLWVWIFRVCQIFVENCLSVSCQQCAFWGDDNFRMNTRYGRYGAAYNMIGLCWFNEELSLLPKNPTEAKLQATSTPGESTEPT
jgi:hypothetical protein